ncbi:DUF6714 family protein [Duganella sp. Root1480D1]|uniref:DUF6714 family protein n=1 Tax=Duganella sp. Root1480D1 TaxID=1736471 RepID=UPI0035A6DDDF
MPSNELLTLHSDKCSECEYVRENIERFRSSCFGEAGAQVVYLELSHLTAQAWNWMLPHYLRFCISDEAKNESTLTAFFLYQFYPVQKLSQLISHKLFSLNMDQFLCLAHFLTWALNDPIRRDEDGEDIKDSITFLKELIQSRTT